MNEFPIAFFTTLNIGSFIYFGVDKRKALKHQYRITEGTLLTMTFFGGTIGSILGMLIFNHKTNKKSFVLKILGILLLQILIIYLISNYNR
jgi:uncharacterized membrane protein YsdA (DUF1294 family)